MSERFSGRIKSFDASTGKGLGGKDVFFHASAIRSKGAQSLRPGQAVEFAIERDSNGLKAVEVELKPAPSR
jgi:cold shock CspA family protein